ncbi:MAG: hypothetical protein EA412_13915 [Chitinophagaceae bacterium]|nr:MAG: hypothetical protein EA412_13915 [Chitinophagaceae bacterium]
MSLIKRLHLTKLIFFLPIIVLVSCAEQTPFEDELLEKLILAQKGDIIEIEEGVYHFTRTLSIMDKEDITLRGRGIGKTILRFDNQTEGAEGILISGKNITIEDLSVYNTKGDAIKARDSDGITFRNLEVIWEGQPDTSHGAYGLYPVSSNNVVIENCRARGASDAGIYVGQSKNVIIRNNHAWENVCGIEVENSFFVEVYENLVENNTSGLMIINLPELPQINGSDVRVYNNQIIGNNHYNFAHEGNLASMIPSGSGLLIMAYRNIDAFDNIIENNNTVNAAIVSYKMLDRPYDDENFNPYNSSINLFNNQFGRGGMDPDIENPIGAFMTHLFGDNRFPDVFIDAFDNPANFDDDGVLIEERRICLNNNTNMTSAKWNIEEDGSNTVEYDSDLFDCDLNPLPNYKMRNL